ncbi:FKBP-type peptidyl-prolyl cis-trans isomerase [Sediminitomix flava]|uniref:Peptidyl-prolyl cis-trans isomerase n=1 Tax=Sediminitomix flava TaxID=379075 RepID=A0A315Z7Q1_SEDFL|nr:FKBP-type peptidyl-prolyl cis-trans isomerase [Sediminitomix flava]PWJ39230.1 FKBP-type peptidyl-prolyl isomerase-like protein [Sediminitomix flava]
MRRSIIYSLLFLGSIFTSCNNFGGSEFDQSEIEQMQIETHIDYLSDLFAAEYGLGDDFDFRQVEGYQITEETGIHILPIPSPFPQPDTIINATVGDTLLIDYIGSTLDGVIFDQSTDISGPFEMVVGATDVIPGWTEVFRGELPVGGSTIYLFPSATGYGVTGRLPEIKSNAILQFEVTIDSVNFKAPI